MKKILQLQHKLANDQSGQASIFITLILIFVMAAITIGINEVDDHNISESLYSQLSTQATYAAESGVNDAIYSLQHNGTIPNNDTLQCNSFISTNSLTPIISGSGSGKVSYTCLTVNSAPSSLLTTVNTSSSSVLKISPSAPTNSLTFSWPLGTGGNTLDCNTSQEFVPQAYTNDAGVQAGWDCPSGVLRLDIFNQLGATSYNSSQSLEKDTDSFYVFPVMNGSGTDTISFGTNPQPAVVSADCSSATNTCSETFTITGGLASGYVRLTSYYVDAGTVTVTAGDQAVFDGSQVEIDSTGVDQGEAKRISVRVDDSNSNPTQAPSYAIGGDGHVCKRYAVVGNVTDSGGAVADPGLSVPFIQGNNEQPLCGGALKPAIYLYPTHDELVNVKISYPTGLAASIPTYDSQTGWNVMAQPNGTLTSTTDGKNYPYLYWEGNEDNFNFNMSQGFVVPGKDTAAFLTKELAIIGLNKNEIASFLQFWVPKMQNNPYSLIHFAGSDYTKMAPLTITPKPNAVLRVFMAEEPISVPVKVTPQTFTPFHRTGFTVVEWGGSILQ
jgi:hypothetical protein